MNFQICFKSRDFLFFLKGVCNWIFPFHIYFHICANFHTKQKLVMTCKLECFQSHCHILSMNFVHDGCLNIFGKCRFVFSFFLGKLWIGDKAIWGWMYNLSGVPKKKCHKKKNMNPFTIKLRLIMSPSF